MERPFQSDGLSYRIECCEMATALPFVYNSSIISNGRKTWFLPRYLHLNSSDSNLAQSTWGIDLETRDEWAGLPAAMGPELTRRIPNLDSVEIDNSFGSTKCNPAKTHLTVVEFNAERGRHWIHEGKILRDLDPEIIILNEMDIGMARSGQQHTTKLLAGMLEMNYAWALEFVELTRGTRSEQNQTNEMYNSLGLHGNAVLSKCPLSEPVVIRDEIGAYFSDGRSGVNANGFEKRLGGRMAVLVSLELGRGRSIVIGSTRKPKCFPADSDPGRQEAFSPGPE